MHIINYIGYTTAHKIYVHGRVLGNRPIKVSVEDGFIRNIWNSIRRAMTRELCHEELTVHYRDQLFPVTTDNEGYFNLRADVPNGESNSNTWDIAYVIHPDAKSVAALYPFTPHVPFGIISDIDDTILETGAGGFLMLGLIWRSLTQNIFSRSQIDTMSDLYSRLHNEYKIPIAYLSNSPTNFNNILRSFLHHNSFPAGPLFLRDYGFPTRSQRKKMRDHKIKTITQLILDNPGLSWVCIGDDTSHDLDVYNNAKEKYPDRILSIHIRNTDNRKESTSGHYSWSDTHMLSEQIAPLITK